MGKLLNTYFVPNIIRESRLRMFKLTGHAARMKDTRNAYKILIRKTEEKNIINTCKYLKLWLKVIVTNVENAFVYLQKTPH